MFFNVPREEVLQDLPKQTRSRLQEGTVVRRRSGMDARKQEIHSKTTMDQPLQHQLCPHVQPRRFSKGRRLCCDKRTMLEDVHRKTLQTRRGMLFPASPRLSKTTMVHARYRFLGRRQEVHVQRRSASEAQIRKEQGRTTQTNQTSKDKQLQQQQFPAMQQLRNHDQQ